MENTTDRGGGTHGRAPATHGRAPPGCAVSLRVAVCFPAVFPATLPYIADVPRLIKRTEFIPNTLLFAFYLHPSFRLVLERERGSGEELR